MSILVTYASKHGSTREIAERIAGKLRQRGKEVAIRPMEDVEQLASYEALVIGSPIYYGSWMKEATAWVHRNLAVLTARPVWLFSARNSEMGGRQHFARRTRAGASPALVNALMMHKRDAHLSEITLFSSRLRYVTIRRTRAHSSVV